VRPHKVHDLIGVTGSIGSGKSTVAGHLAEVSGAYFLDADQVCRDLLFPGKEGWQALKDVFGNRFFGPDQHLDRQKLREAIFADASLRAQVDAILHPLALLRVLEHAGQIRHKDPAARIVVEIPLLFEAGWQDYFVRIIVVRAEKSICRQRLMERDKVTSEAADAALNAQWPIERKEELADHIIDNSGPWSEVALRVEEIKNIIWPENKVKNA
jgi:dephospho-CoA kinase